VLSAPQGFCQSGSLPWILPVHKRHFVRNVHYERFEQISQYEPLFLVVIVTSFATSTGSWMCITVAITIVPSSAEALCSCRNVEWRSARCDPEKAQFVSRKNGTDLGSVVCSRESLGGRAFGSDWPQPRPLLGTRRGRSEWPLLNQETKRVVGSLAAPKVNGVVIKIGNWFCSPLAARSDGLVLCRLHLNQHPCYMCKSCIGHGEMVCLLRSNASQPCDR
jgi:hypothetical protein